MDKNKLKRARSLRRAIFAKARNRLLAARKGAAPQPAPAQFVKNLGPSGYDPELLFVECGRCGAPVIWEEGKATELLREAGIDPLELDASCVLVTEACPACGSGNEYGVRIFRIASQDASLLPPTLGHA